MDRTDISNEYKRLAETIREKDLGELLSLRGIPTNKSAECPFCGGGKNTPCASYDKKRNRWHCFSCGGDYSVLDFIALENNLDAKRDFRKVVEIGAPMFGLEVPQHQNQPKIERIHNTHTHNIYTQPIHTTQAKPMSDKTQTQGTDYSEYFAKCHARLKDAQAYLEKRGLSADICERFQIGFDPAWKSPNAGEKVPSSPRLIIPVGKYWYTARDTRENLTEIQNKYKKMKVNSAPNNEATPFFNEKALEENVVFVVEGELDAVSIEALGFHAVGLGSASRVVPFCDRVQKTNRNAILLLALDNEQGVGEAQTAKLQQELRGRGIRCEDVSKALYGQYKDANECLAQDMGHFEEALAETKENALELFDKERSEKKEAYKLENQGSEAVRSLVLLSEREGVFFPSGFQKLDKLLDGGFYAGFYIIGAISSLGKTALTLQIADQIASGADACVFNFESKKEETKKEEARDVLIFSLEMSRTELVGRSVSRITCQKALEMKKHPSDIARSYREISSPSLRRIQDHKEGASALLMHSIEDYGKGAGKHVYIVEGMGDIGTYEIRKKVEEHIDLTGNKPLVIIDYLQMLAPCLERGTDKQNTDKAVLELKRMSRDLSLPVIAISSFNRGSYSSGATMSSFKESGSIEYTADALIGLSLKGMEFDSDNPKAKEVQKKESELKSRQEGGENVREITLTILKNRSGLTGVETDFRYYPKYNLFREV